MRSSRQACGVQAQVQQCDELKEKFLLHFSFKHAKILSITKKEPERMSAKPLREGPLFVDLPKSSAYYQALYVKRGESGLFRDSMGCAMLQRDVLATQRELARRLTSAIAADEDEDEDEALMF